MDVDSSSHLTMLEEAGSYEKIVEFCKRIYSGKGVGRNNIIGHFYGLGFD